ncbi:MAG TPA: formate-dependent phosphoribosylglycinamide formyltransferase [Fimbriimonadaceae bacterium]|nr:formate-dependent phosphoribosylglycinamide formyltransferase [Fimbriimonadaceae bacterium]
MRNTILLLGSGELGKELTISLSRLGQKVVAVDSYDGAPAHQVTPYREVVDMLDGEALARLVEKHKPDLIVPEIEAIRTDRLYEFEEQGIQVVPSAKAVNFTMNRKAIRDLAARDLGIRTAPYRYASTLEEFRVAVEEIGIPCVVKPLMSSSGKGQSTIRTQDEVEGAWQVATLKGRGDLAEVIVEGFVEFDREITLLTITQKNGDTLFCPPVGHRQERGDYMESWLPCDVSASELHAAEEMAWQITKALGGAGIWGVEFFLSKDGVVFSELSPRPHDTGMVTLAGCLPYTEFDLHARAILGLPIPLLNAYFTAASAVILAEFESGVEPTYEGIEDAMQDPWIDIRIFGKPSTRVHRRMGVALAKAPLGTSVDEVRARAIEAASKVTVRPGQ